MDGETKKDGETKEATKPRRLNREETEEVMLWLLNIARFARLGPSPEEIESYIRDAGMMDTVAPILDPTLWMRGHKKNDLFLKIARALQTFRTSLPTIEEAVEADRIAASFAHLDDDV